jgi:methionyl-tRNA formyltransferase
MLRIAFAGTPEFAVPALRALADSGHVLVGVLTQPDRPAGRGRQSQSSAVKRLAESLGVPVAQPPARRAEAEREALKQWAPDVLIVAAYGLILPPAALAIPRLGCINIHASLLPRWRGAAPIERAILAGDRDSGITIMQMEAGLDTGPMLRQRRMPVGDASSAQLRERLAALGAALLLEVLPDLESGSARPEPQPAVGVSYAPKINKREAVIDWNRAADEIARQVRAFNPWPVANTQLDGEGLRIWEARAAPAATLAAAPGTVLGLSGEQLLVACGSGTLAIAQLQLAGRRVLSAPEFTRGRPLAQLRLG